MVTRTSSCERHYSARKKAGAVERLIGVGTFPQSKAVNEEQWLDAARRGQDWALEQFFQCYQPAVYALCHRLLGRAEDAEDATQAAFVRAFVALPKFRGNSQVKTWLYRIAVNEALGLLRKRGDAPVELDETFPASSPGQEYDNVQEHLAVQRALWALKPEHRAILTLRFWEELSYEEIALVLNARLPTVKMRLARAREQFQKCYEVGD